MVGHNEVRVTGVRCLEVSSGSAAGVIGAGGGVRIVVSAEAGEALFGSGARFAAGVQLDGARDALGARLEGFFGDREWPSPVSELAFLLPEEATADLADRMIGVSAFVRVGISQPFLVSTMRGPDLFVVPAAAPATPPDGIVVPQAVSAAPPQG
jgi:hypothetical protein